MTYVVFRAASVQGKCFLFLDGPDPGVLLS